MENRPFIKLVLNMNMIKINIEVIFTIVPIGLGNAIREMNAIIEKVNTYIILLCLEVLIFKRVVNKHMLTYTSIKHKNNPLMFINVSLGVLIAFHIV